MHINIRAKAYGHSVLLMVTLKYTVYTCNFMFIQTGWSIGGAGGGMAVGVFTLGMLVPWTNSFVFLIYLVFLNILY